MASEVDICNISLGRLGDSANIQSINPPDGSAQAEHCMRFYPIARDSLMEMHSWGFCVRRVALASLASNPASGWGFAYIQPTDILNTIGVLDPNAQDDLSVGIAYPSQWNEVPLTNGGVYTPQPFQLESLADGTDILLTNQANAVLRYTARVTDTAKFSPLFTDCLTWSLASMLAGPVIKGEAGMAMAAKCQMIAFGQNGKSGRFGIAAASDAGQRKTNVRDKQQVTWLNAR